MKEKYLLDEFIISKFLGIGIDDSAVEIFLKRVREMLMLLVSNFLFDYSVRKNISIDVATAAYIEYLGYVDGSLVEPEELEPVPKKEIYRVLGDEHFYNELEKRVDDYIGKIYAQYVPELTEDLKEELDEYIGQKAKDKDNNLAEMISSIDNSLNELEVMETQLENKLDKMRQMGGLNRMF